MKEKDFNIDRERKSLVSLYSLNENAPAGHPDPEQAPKKRVIREKDAAGVKKAVMEMITERIGNGAFELDLGAIKDPKDRCDVVLKLMQFVLPKVSAVDVTGALEVDSVSDEISRLAQQTASSVVASTAKELSS